MDQPQVSIVIATYNDGAYLRQSIDLVVSALAQWRYRYELVFVDDASTDASREIICAYCRQHPDTARYLLLSRNGGRGRAVSEGMRIARAPIVGYLDIDCETHPVYIARLAERIEAGVEVACARRVYTIKADSLLRWLMNRGYNFLVRRYLGMPFEDTETGCKFFRREAILPILAQVQDPHWFWDTEVIARAFVRGLRIEEIPTLFIRRRDKKSSVRVVRDTLYYLKKIHAFKRQLVPAMRARYWYVHGKEFSSYYTNRRFPQGLLRRFLNARTERVLAAVPPRAGMRILDLGCGSAELVPLLRARAARVIALDFSMPMLRDAKLLLRKTGIADVPLVACEAQMLALRDASFDLVVCVGVLDYIASVSSALSEIRRVLKPQGEAVVTVPLRASPFFFLRGPLGERVRRALFKLPPIVTSLSAREMIEACRAAGFAVQGSSSLYHTTGIFSLTSVSR